MRTGAQIDGLIARRVVRPDNDLALWRLGGSPQSPAAMGLWMAGLMAIFSMFIMKSIKAQAGVMIWPMISQFLFMMPSVMVGGQLMQRWDRLSGELLRPVRRETMVRNMVLSVLADTAIVWLFTIGAAIFVLRTGDPDFTTVRAVAELIVLSAVSQALGAASSVWAASFRSMGKYLLLSLPIILIVYGLASLWWYKQNIMGPIGFAALAAVLSIAAWGMFLAAHRRWCRVELG